MSEPTELELPGMWEEADFMGGETDDPLADCGETERLLWWADQDRRSGQCGDDIRAAHRLMVRWRNLATYYRNVNSEMAEALREAEQREKDAYERGWQNGLAYGETREHR